jgi:hypothetical protein
MQNLKFYKNIDKNRTIIRNKVKKKNIILFNIDDAFETSNMDKLCDGQIIISLYTRITASNTIRSLNKKPVTITYCLNQESRVFFCKKSNRKPSFQMFSLRL